MHHSLQIGNFVGWHANAANLAAFKYITLTADAVGVRILLFLGSRYTTPIHILTCYGSLEEFNMQHRNLQ